MKFKKSFVFIICLILSFGFISVSGENVAFADTNKSYYTVYDESKKNIILLKGGEVNEGDKYLSGDNKLYVISNIDELNKTAIAKFLNDEKLPEYNVRAKSKETVAKAAVSKKVGVYHTHNDECYFTPDGVDSVYGKGGIHDVGKAFVSNLEKLGVSTIYREDLHLPHNSGAYTRSQVTAAALLDSGANAIFDLHRDSTKRDYYLTKVDGKQMSSIRMVVGSSSSNYEENKKFAYSIKSYADSVYPGLIKDIYFGKGNYNQQLSSRAMLFEMGCENIEKDLVIKSTEYLAKKLDVVLYGSENASKESLEDISLLDANGNVSTISGVASVGEINSTVNSNNTLYIILGVVGAVLLTLAIVLLVSKKARYKVGRFFSEMFAGIFGKKKIN
jgi:stage II sporulation protein P